MQRLALIFAACLCLVAAQQAGARATNLEDQQQQAHHNNQQQDFQHQDQNDLFASQNSQPAPVASAPIVEQSPPQSHNHISPGLSQNQPENNQIPTLIVQTIPVVSSQHIVGPPQSQNSQQNPSAGSAPQIEPTQPVQAAIQQVPPQPPQPKVQNPPQQVFQRQAPQNVPASQAIIAPPPLPSQQQAANPNPSQNSAQNQNQPSVQQQQAQSQQPQQVMRSPQVPNYQPAPPPPPPPPPSANYHSSTGGHHQPASPLYLGHNPFIEILRPFSYADDNIVTVNLSHSHIYEIDSDAFVGQRYEQIDLSNNKLGLIHSRSFRIGPMHSRHNPFPPSNNSKANGAFPTRRPPPSHPQSVTIDFSHNPAIVALSGAFDNIDVPNVLLNFTNSTVELKFGAFKKYFKDHPGHLIDIDSVDCCEQEWLLGYKHNFVARTHCDHDPSLLLSKVTQQHIIDSCIQYVTSARHSMTIQGPSIIHQGAAQPRGHSNSHVDHNQYFTYLILGGTAMILTSLSIYIIFYMFSLKAAFVYQMTSQNKN